MIYSTKNNTYVQTVAGYKCISENNVITDVPETVKMWKFGDINISKSTDEKYYYGRDGELRIPFAEIHLKDVDTLFVNYPLILAVKGCTVTVLFYNENCHAFGPYVNRNTFNSPIVEATTRIVCNYMRCEDDTVYTDFNQKRTVVSKGKPVKQIAYDCILYCDDSVLIHELKCNFNERIRKLVIGDNANVYLIGIEGKVWCYHRHLDPVEVNVPCRVDDLACFDDKLAFVSENKVIFDDHVHEMPCKPVAITRSSNYATVILEDGSVHKVDSDVTRIPYFDENPALVPRKKYVKNARKI